MPVNADASLRGRHFPFGPMKNQFTKRRVMVLGTIGFVRYAHEQEARRLIESEQAKFVDGASIQLVSGLGSMSRSARDDDRPSTSSLKTTRTQYLDCGGRIIQHKRIDDRDRPIYRMALTQNYRIVSA